MFLETKLDYYGVCSAARISTKALKNAKIIGVFYMGI
jgi:hypothetical protein